METIRKKIIGRSAFLFLMLGICAAGIQTALRRSQENLPAAVRTALPAAPVIVLDAGHGAYAET